MLASYQPIGQYCPGLTVFIALQLDTHNLMPLLRLSNYYEVSLHLHRCAFLFAGRVQAEWAGLALPQTLLMGQA